MGVPKCAARAAALISPPVHTPLGRRKGIQLYPHRRSGSAPLGALASGRAGCPSRAAFPREPDAPAPAARAPQPLRSLALSLDAVSCPLCRFYRWLSERYPLINHSIDSHTVPGFDCFYLDMNGIVHNCSHPEDESMKPKNEADMMSKIFNYLDRLFHVVKPQRVCYMAIDGCAPRAKMNQQRARRFRAAQEMQQARAKEQALALADEDYEVKEVFDSNCITPGTPFMVRPCSPSHPPPDPRRRRRRRLRRRAGLVSRREPRCARRCGSRAT
eukprot:COSAG04_NODE_56_length_30604_cov_692.571119_8_plen_272_part_00